MVTVPDVFSSTTLAEVKFVTVFVARIWLVTFACVPSRLKVFEALVRRAK